MLHPNPHLVLDPEESNLPNIDHYLKDILSIGKTSFNLNEYNYIPTVKYRDQIAQLSKDLHKYCNFNRFAILIIYNNQRYFLSNTYNDLAIPHDIYHLSQLDISTLESTYQNKSYFFPAYDIINPIYDAYKMIIGNYYKFYKIYTLVRICNECHVLLYAANTEPPENLEKCKEIYRSTYKAFEKFSIEFLDQAIYNLTLHSNKIKHSRIFYDKNFRKQLIRGIYEDDIRFLTEKESECLHWASFGKTAEDTALIMNISAYTVRQHLKDCIKKLKASNVTNAVCKAIKSNLI
jgi:DNA-binding CsgD family transcriptional regulator